MFLVFDGRAVEPSTRACRVKVAGGPAVVKRFSASREAAYSDQVFLLWQKSFKVMQIDRLTAGQSIRCWTSDTVACVSDVKLNGNDLAGSHLFSAGRSVHA